MVPWHPLKNCTVGKVWPSGFASRFMFLLEVIWWLKVPPVSKRKDEPSAIPARNRTLIVLVFNFYSAQNFLGPENVLQ